jgi:hypothetical protein
MSEPRPETVPYTEAPPLPPDAPFAAEWHALRRAMPQLLAEGHEGHSALIRGDTIIGVYADRAEALTEAYRRFPDGQYIVPYIESRVRIVKLGRAAQWLK